MRAISRALLAIAVAGAAVAVSVGASTAARQTAQSADGQPTIVEDFSYPGADKIFTDRAIKLISGDGHLLLVDCTNVSSLIEVRASNVADHGSDPGHYCFKVNGPSGDLKLELVNAYQVKNDSHNVQATVSVDGKTSTVTVTGWTGIGVGDSMDAATLLELKASS